MRKGESEWQILGPPMCRGRWTMIEWADGKHVEMFSTE